MSAKILVSTKEKQTLLILLAIVGALLAVYLILGRLARGFLFTQSSKNTAKIALILPLTGDQAWIGKGQQAVAQAVLDAYQQELSEKDWSVSLSFADSGSRVNSSASAAQKAGQNLYVVALIAPYDSRQTLAAAETAARYSLPVIAPASSGGILSAYPADNLYFMVSQDNQEEALVSALVDKDLTSAMLVVQPTDYWQAQVTAFNQVADKRVMVRGTLLLDEQSQTLLAEKISSAEEPPNVILFFGEPDGLQTLLGYMTAANIQLPIFSTDTIQDAKLLTFNRAGVDIYYTSPYFNAGQVDTPLDIAQGVAKQYSSIPFAYETASAVESVIQTLLSGQPSNSNRKLVYGGLKNVIQPYSSARVFEGHTRRDARIYLYHLKPDQTDWNLIPIVQ